MDDGFQITQRARLVARTSVFLRGSLNEIVVEFNLVQKRKQYVGARTARPIDVCCAGVQPYRCFHAGTEALYGAGDGGPNNRP